MNVLVSSVGSIETLRQKLTYVPPGTSCSEHPPLFSVFQVPAQDFSGRRCQDAYMQQLLRILARAAVIVVIASLFPAKLHASDWWLDASYAQPLRWNVGAFLFFDRGRRIIVGGNVGPNGMQAWGGKLLDRPGGGSNGWALDLRAVITRTRDNPRGASPRRVEGRVAVVKKEPYVRVVGKGLAELLSGPCGRRVRREGCRNSALSPFA
jgi:hypothetical protein